MARRRSWIPVALVTSGSLLASGIALQVFVIRDWQLWCLLGAAALSGSGLLWLVPRRSDESPEDTAFRRELARKSAELDEQVSSFQLAKTELLGELNTRSQRLDERERDLVSRFARFHEFLEYPIEDLHAERASGELQKLTEQDRQVRQLLEAEAERVYEKIRRNGYTVDGKVDAAAIREEAFQLVQNVAKIYKPDSVNPLLETSFDQLARAASRMWLHILVLLEQLPVNVQHYNISTLYSYVRKAIVGYGVYQQASPWLSYLSRGLYMGRMAAAANPATISAWWLATELGKRGAQKVIENVVDRQAIAILHQLITVVGVEAAGIYGTGFRQRDPAWIQGTELVELIHSFPESTDCLKQGLQQVTVLPLRSEYDRIYLYRCLATHRSAGLHLADPSMLTREEREAIAERLESFFRAHIRGASDANLRRWREGVEHRFDIRLKLDISRADVAVSRASQLEQAADSLVAFLRDVAAQEGQVLEQAVRSLKTVAAIDEQQRQALFDQLSAPNSAKRFAAPALEPSSDVTDLFLKDLAACCTVVDTPDDQLETFVCEAWACFRRPAEEARQAIDKSWQQKTRWHCRNEAMADELPPGLARIFFQHRQPHEKLWCWYGSLDARTAESTIPLPSHWLLGIEGYESSGRRVLVVSSEKDGLVIWQKVAPFTVERIPGLLIDDVAIPDGEWNMNVATLKKIPANAKLGVSGSLRGGRFRTYFARLLEINQSGATSK